MIKYNRSTEIDVIMSNMVEITFPDGPTDGFRKVKETIERMGVPSRETKTLYQSAHVFHKRDRYYICHFKELFALDGKSAELSTEDIGRRNLIVKFLTDWGMITPVTDAWKDPMILPYRLKVIKYNEKNDWDIVAKYTIGNKKQ